MSSSSHEECLFGIDPMSGNHRKRLDRLEQKLADDIPQEALVNCICLERLFVASSEKFQSEANKTCPVHGFRRLGVITVVWIVPTRKDRTGNPDGPEVGLEEAVEEYKRRLAQVEQLEDEKEYGC